MPRKKTHEEFVAEVYQKLGPDYKVLSQYTNAHGKVLMKHHKCGNTFEKNIHDIVTKGSGCPFCNGTKPSLYNGKMGKGKYSSALSIYFWLCKYDYKM